MESSSQFQEFKKEFQTYIEANPNILNSSQGKDIIVMFGITGAGKSTLTNFLCNVKLNVVETSVNKKGKITGGYLVPDKSDKRAKEVNSKGKSCTVLPNVESYDGLNIYDLPGLADTRECYSLINASIIKNIIDKANSVKVVFVVGFPEFEAERGKSFNKIRKAAEEIFKGSGGLDECSCLIVTKCVEDDTENLIAALESKLEDKLLICPWSKNGNLGMFSKPEEGKIDEDQRKDIIDVIKRLKQKKLNVNPNKLFDQLETINIESYYTNEIKEVLSNYTNSFSLNLNSLNLDQLNGKKIFCKENFVKEINTQLGKSEILNMMKMVTNEIYETAYKTINLNESLNKLILNIDNLIIKKEKEIEEQKRKEAEEKAKIEEQRRKDEEQKRKDAEEQAKIEEKRRKDAEQKQKDAEKDLEDLQKKQKEINNSITRYAGGPYSNWEGEKFVSDESMVKYGSITGWRVRSGVMIHFIQFRFGNGYWGNMHGGNHDKNLCYSKTCYHPDKPIYRVYETRDEEVTLWSDEKITSITIRVGGAMDGIKIETNRSNYEYGGAGGDPIKLSFTKEMAYMTSRIFYFTLKVDVIKGKEYQPYVPIGCGTPTYVSFYEAPYR